MTDKWLHAYDFNSYGGVFIGHRGCARISDCQKRYYYLVQVEKDPDKPRLYIYRLNWEKLDESLERLKTDDSDAYGFLKELLLNRGIKWKEYKMVPVETEDHTVRLEKRLIEVK